MCPRIRIRLALAAGLFLSSRATAQVPNIKRPPAATTSNVVTGMIIHDTWDPGDPLTISGFLHDNFDPAVGHTVACFLGTLVDSADRAVLAIDGPAVGLAVGPGHIFCGATPLARTFAPGTDPSGHFSLTTAGGGVSWLAGSGIDPLGPPPGSTMSITFTKGIVDPWTVFCGGTAYGFACDNAPHIYGVLASPDLNGDEFVSQSDLVAFTNLYLGQTITVDRGWQADFNHDGHPTVDAGDFAYFVGRLGHNCVMGKPTTTAGTSYAMDVHNLELDYVRTAMASLGVTNAQIIDTWDQMGLSYDHEAATGLRKPVATEARSWTHVKELYR